MGYTLLTEDGTCSPIRIIDVSTDTPRLGTAFEPAWWICDSCAPSAKRFEVTHANDCRTVQVFPWWQIVLSDDDERTIKCKMDTAFAAVSARYALQTARNRFVELWGYNV